MNELLACPFCGGEAELKRYQSGDWQVICYHTDGCIMLESDLDNCYWENVQTLARQWNARHQCGLADEDYNILLDELGVSERTCHIEWRDDSFDTDAGYEHDGVYFCTACRADLPYPLQECWDDYQADHCEKPFNYCPNCGARVVE